MVVGGGSASAVVVVGILEAYQGVWRGGKEAIPPTAEMTEVSSGGPDDRFT